MNAASHPGVLVNNWLPHSFCEGSGMPAHSRDRGLHSEKVSQRTTSGLSSVTKTICPYSERDDWLLGGKQTFGVPLCSCHRDPRGMCPSLLWKFASGSCSEAGWQTSISPSTLTVAKGTTHTGATSVTTLSPFSRVYFIRFFIYQMNCHLSLLCCVKHEEEGVDQCFQCMLENCQWPKRQEHYFDVSTSFSMEQECNISSSHTLRAKDFWMALLERQRHSYKECISSRRVKIQVARLCLCTKWLKRPGRKTTIKIERGKQRKWKSFLSKCTALTNVHCVQRCFTSRSDRWPPLLWFPPNLRHISASEHASGPSHPPHLPLSRRFSPLHTAVMLGSLTQTRSGDRTGKWDVKHLLFWMVLSWNHLKVQHENRGTSTLEWWFATFSVFTFYG